MRPALHPSLPCVRARIPGACMLAGVMLVLASCGEAPPASGRGTDVAAALGGSDTTGYARARERRAFSFPDDHGPHLEFKTEWWYFTGNLLTDDGRRFGYQLTFFRDALAPEQPPRRSAWATRQLGFAHFALSDPERERFSAFERFTRWSGGTAGAVAAPFRVWLDDWSVREDGDAWLLTAREGALELSLRLRARKAPVLQGDAGLSRKSSGVGNASYYYSMTRLETEGWVTDADGERASVRGWSWLDREWSTSVLTPDQEGWDWFSLHLDDGRDVMVYRLRLRNGGVDAASKGSIVDAEGGLTVLAASDVELTVQETWRSPRSGAVYPVRWRLRIPSHNIDGTVRAVSRDQELPLTITYWEGAVDFTAVRNGGDAGMVSGRGYVELTGYAATDGR